MMKTYALSHIGLVRTENQDRHFVREFEDRTILLAVADGMGGEAGGGLASRIAIEAVKKFNTHLVPPEESFAATFHDADRRIRETTRHNLRLNGMGTTLTSAYLKNGDLHWAHVGDSRLYLLRAGQMTQVTEDDTLVTRLVKEGAITREQARNHPMQNMLFHCLGCPSMRMSYGQFKVQAEDLVLLCSDGLYHEVNEEKIVSIMRKNIGLQQKLEDLLQAALDSGGHDNITLVGLVI